MNEPVVTLRALGVDDSLPKDGHWVMVHGQWFAYEVDFVLTRLHLLETMAPLNHEPMCESDGGEDLDECNCWKAVMTREINATLGGNRG